MRDATIAIYQRARVVAETKGIIIADTKFEFGMEGDDILLIDEVLTPDSSRFWPMDGYRPGKTPDSFDKQFVRDYLLGLNWNMKAAGAGTAAGDRQENPGQIFRSAPAANRLATWRRDRAPTYQRILKHLPTIRST